MLPFILAAVGGYLIGYSVKSDTTKMKFADALKKKQVFAEGGVMADGGSLKGFHKKLENMSNEELAEYVKDNYETDDRESEILATIKEDRDTYIEDLVLYQSFQNTYNKKKKYYPALAHGGMTAEGGDYISYGIEYKDKEPHHHLPYAYAEGGVLKGRNTETGETYGVVIGSQKKSDEINSGTEINVRKKYGERISECKLIFNSEGNLYRIIDYGYSVGAYPNTSYGQAHTYNADKKETLQVLSEEYNPSFAKKIISLIINKQNNKQ